MDIKNRLMTLRRAENLRKWRKMKECARTLFYKYPWQRATGVLIPKEKGATYISQFHPICFLILEGKIFFSLVAQRLCAYLERNKYIDTTVQNAGFSGCLEHLSMIWHQIQAAKKDKTDLHVVFLDLANAFGSVPHNLSISSTC